jgi:hypothetical protein
LGRCVLASYAPTVSIISPLRLDLDQSNIFVLICQKINEKAGLLDKIPSDLMRGRLSGFSTERLFKFLNDLGRDVEIVVKPKPRSRHRAKIRVVAA